MYFLLCITIGTDVLLCAKDNRDNVKTYFLAVSWDGGFWGYCEYMGMNVLCHAMIDLLYSHISYVFHMTAFLLN